MDEPTKGQPEFTGQDIGQDPNSAQLPGLFPGKKWHQADQPSSAEWIPHLYERYKMGILSFYLPHSIGYFIVFWQNSQAHFMIVVS